MKMSEAIKIHEFKTGTSKFRITAERRMTSGAVEEERTSLTIEQFDTDTLGAESWHVVGRDHNINYDPGQINYGSNSHLYELATLLLCELAKHHL